MNYIFKTRNNNKPIRLSILVSLCLLSMFMLGWATFKAFGDTKTVKTGQQSSHSTHVYSKEAIESYVPRVYTPNMAQ